MTAGVAILGTDGANAASSSNPVPVSIAGSSASSTVDFTKLNGTATDTNSGNKSAGTLRVVLATDQPALTNKLLVTPDAGSTVKPIPATSGGLSISRTLSANNTTGIVVKASAGQVYTIIAHNTNAAARFLKIYNKATAPTVGTDTPVMTLPIPGNTAGAGFVMDVGGMGIAFATGIGIGITTGVADADTGAPAANECVVNILFA